MFPWRTISGEEASAYYAAGTAQYHINADIMYGLRKYVQATGDEAFLRDCGGEMLVETSRLWLDLGFYSDAISRLDLGAIGGPIALRRTTSARLLKVAEIVYRQNSPDGAKTKLPTAPAKRS